MDMHEALTDYRKAQASGLHHADCDGWMALHRVEITTTVGGFEAVCDECGKLGVGSFGRRADCVRFQAGHGQEVKCDGRCNSWD